MPRFPRSLALTLAFLALALSGSATRAAELDPFLPADTESFATINVRQILDSDLFKAQVRPAVKDALDNLPDVAAVLKDLGFDPLKDLDRLTFASPSSGETDRGLVIAHGKFDVAKFRKKADDTVRDHEEIMKKHKVPDGVGGTETLYEMVVPGQPSAFVCLYDATTLLASPGKDYVVDAIKTAKAKKKVALKNAEFQALLEKLDPKQSVALAVLGKTLKGAALNDAPAGVKGLIEKVEVIGGGITLDKDVKLEIAISTKNDEDAKEIRDGIDRGLKLALAGLALIAGDSKEVGFALDVVKSLKVAGKGKVVILKGRVLAETIEEALKKD